MSLVSTLGLQITLLVAAVASSPLIALAEGSVDAQQVGLARIDIQGLGPDASASVREALIEALTDLGAEVPASTSELEIAEECLTRSDCLRAELRDAGVEGVFSARVIRVGPIVRVAIRAHDAESGLELMTTESTAPAGSFPDPSLLSGDLERGLELLMRLHPPPPPEPVPAPDSLPVEEPPALSEATALEAEASPPQPDAEASLDPQKSGLWGAVGIGSLGVGGTMLIGGAAAGAWWLMLRQELSQDCASPEGCPASQYQATLDQYHLTGYAAPILFGAGALTAALGMVSLLVLE